MNLKEKLLFLEEKTKLSKNDFCAYYQIPYFKYKLLLNDKDDGVKNHLDYLIEVLNFDKEDFLNDNSSLKNELNEGEHFCKMKVNYKNGEVIYEDFAREENSRYEEKD